MKLAANHPLMSNWSPGTAPPVKIADFVGLFVAPVVVMSSHPQSVTVAVQVPLVLFDGEPVALHVGHEETALELELAQTPKAGWQPAKQNCPPAPLFEWYQHPKMMRIRGLCGPLTKPLGRRSILRRCSRHRSSPRHLRNSHLAICHLMRSLQVK